MKRAISILSSVLLVAILATSFSLLPSDKVEVVLPNQETEIVYNVYTKNVELSSNLLVPITVDVYRIDRIDQELIPVGDGINMEKTLDLSFDSAGLYLFVIVSPELVQISFRDHGVRTGLVVVLTLVILVKLALWMTEIDFLLFNPFAIKK